MKVVIAGRPNACKSSLLNALAGREAAIVTDIAGTTRDVLREHIHIDGMPLHIIDTAGLREATDEVERIGISRAWTEIEQADRIILMLDSSDPDSQNIEKVRSEFGEFFQWSPVIEEQVCQPEKVLEQLSDLTAYRVGTGWAAYPQFKDSGLEGSDIILPSAQYMLEFALTDYAHNKVISALDIELVYLRNEVTWKKFPGRE